MKKLFSIILVTITILTSCSYAEVINVIKYKNNLVIEDPNYAYNDKDIFKYGVTKCHKVEKLPNVNELELKIRSGNQEYYYDCNPVHMPGP